MYIYVEYGFNTLGITLGNIYNGNDWQDSNYRLEK